MLRLSGVTKRFGGRLVLDQAGLRVGPGELAFLHGRSGCGKSTLLKLLYRELEPDAGELLLEGTPIGAFKKYELRRRIAVIFQSFELLERRTALENVLLAGEAAGRRERGLREVALRWLARVGLAGKEGHLPQALSGGERQRVAIARALLNRPALLLADEPTGNLDDDTALDMLRLLRELQEAEGTAMLIVTHSSRLAEALPATRWLMEQGKVRKYE